MKKKLSIILVLVAILLCALGGMIFAFKKGIEPLSKDEDIVEVTVSGSSGKMVLKNLADDNIIKNGDIAYYYCRVKKIPMDFKAGKYEVSRSWPLEKLIVYLSDGSNALQDTVSVKLLEGNRIKDFALKIAESTSVLYDELIAYWQDKDIVKTLIKDYPFISEDIFADDVNYYLEGYLFPDTYEFFRETTPKDITIKLLDQTALIYNELKTQFDSSNLTIHQLFTLASIVQRESGNSDEMKDIASVFYNRLNNGMQLQSSVTVCYALDIGLGGDWTKCEITQSSFSPYNTYQIYGLPPGPICAVSKSALEAVLDPNQTDYFFFIGDVCGGGKTIFAKTYAEQLANQETYLTCY